MSEENGPVPGKDRRELPHVSPEEDSIIGSYSSFFGFLLILTILSYRHIMLALVDMVHTGLPDMDIVRIAIVMILIFTLVFIIIPAFQSLWRYGCTCMGRGKN
ncbi:MAG: hypothetical protein GYA23_04525 [Methanomicrobiales archaeon]|nr:hypothetical protein [Methanomicrobiales archaeon]